MPGRTRTPRGWSRGGVVHHYKECGQCHRQFSVNKSHWVVERTVGQTRTGIFTLICSHKCLIAYGQRMEAERKRRVVEQRAVREEHDAIVARHAREGRKRLGLDRDEKGGGT